MDVIKIREIIENLLKALSVNYDDIEVSADSITGRTVFIIKTKESGLLIGDRGETFQALVHLIKKIAIKQSGSEDVALAFSVDVNDYQASNIARLKNKAMILANRARDMKADIEMEPMTSYERLIVHDILGKEQNIKTESIGIGRERRVVIKYQSQSL